MTNQQLADNKKLVCKTAIFIDRIDQGWDLIDTIYLEDSWWLVATYLEGNTTKSRTPERLVRLTGLPYMEVNKSDHRFLLNVIIPTSVLDGRSADGFVVASYRQLRQGGGIH